MNKLKNKATKRFYLNPEEKREVDTCLDQG